MRQQGITIVHCPSTDTSSEAMRQQGVTMVHVLCMVRTGKAGVLPEGDAPASDGSVVPVAFIVSRRQEPQVPEHAWPQGSFMPHVAVHFRGSASNCGSRQSCAGQHPSLEGVPHPFAHTFGFACNWSIEQTDPCWSVLHLEAMQHALQAPPPLGPCTECTCRHVSNTPNTKC
jgi:hypothetical protein